jgi:amidase
MIPVTFLSASVLAEKIRSGDLTSQTIVEAHLARIAEVNPKLNALVQLTAEQALAEARAADADLARGQVRGPLHGVPFTVKDWIETAGVVCAAGDERHRDYVPAQDATVVARMRQAGAILLGKTNVVVDNPVYGRTNNPYNLTYSPSGSSSGEAALIAAGGSPLGLGSDSGGSIRTPAHACGIAGLKPTTGRVPLTGHFPRISAINDPRTVIGPLARSVADLALALSVIQGVDWADASVIPMPLGDWRQVELRGLRAAFYTEHEDAIPDPVCKEATIAAADALASEAASVEESRPPRVGESYAITRDYWRRSESTSLEEWLPDGDFVLSSEQIERHLFAWDRFRRGLIGFMQRFDVIITPAMECPAQPHGQSEGGIAYTLTYSLTGYPAVVLRTGTTPAGLPVGVQVVARPWRDDVALAVAAYLEKRFGGWQPPALTTDRQTK